MYLLDINVLLAFWYKEHVWYSRVTRWIQHVKLTEGGHSMFATCAIVDLGFIRIASGTSRLAENLSVARADLRRVKAELGLTLLGDDLDGNQLPVWVTRSAQTTDGHLLELATQYQMRFATLDSGIPGAVLIPELDAPSMVREPTVLYGEVA
jgi:predicted nucleic acid-binding protein